MLTTSPLLPGLSTPDRRFLGALRPALRVVVAHLPVQVDEFDLDPADEPLVFRPDLPGHRGPFSALCSHVYLVATVLHGYFVSADYDLINKVVLCKQDCKEPSKEGPMKVDFTTRLDVGLRKRLRI